MEECIFCKIIKGEIPCAKLYEDDKVISFLDIAPVSKGHALVLPKEHHETFSDLPESLAEPFFAAIKKVARAQSSALGAEGYNLLVNNKKAAGQIVPHIHMHIVPRKEGDRAFPPWKHMKYNDKEMDEFAENIKKFL